MFLGMGEPPCLKIMIRCHWPSGKDAFRYSKQFDLWINLRSEVVIEYRHALVNKTSILENKNNIPQIVSCFYCLASIL